MSDEQAQLVNIQYTPEFKRNLRQLARKYRRIKADVQPVLEALEQGQTPGDQIPNVQYEVFKVRLSNSDSGKGKSGGYRVIYQRQADGSIVLITLYSKTEQEDIAPNEIRDIIVAYDKQASEAADESVLPDTSASSDFTTERDHLLVVDAEREEVEEWSE